MKAPRNARSVSVDRTSQNTPFQSTTHYNDSFKWVEGRKCYFKAPVDLHTGPIVNQQMETQYRRTFRAQATARTPLYRPNDQLRSIEPLPIAKMSYYKVAYKGLQGERRFDSRGRRLEEMKSINQYELPFCGATVA